MSTNESDVCSHVRVVVRVRPENEKERLGNYRRVVHVVDKHMLVFDPKAQEVNFFQGKKLSNRDISKKANKDLTFVFDGVFDENSTQMEVFQDTTKIVLDGVLNGYNCTVLAYGATGSGKTHTMLGSPAAPGVMFLTMLELYERIELLKDEKVCQVALSYLEVYNEQIRDLLGGSKPLAVCEDAQKGVIVQNLTLHQPKSAEEILQMLDYGNKNRTQHPTDINATSSRSHAVLQIYLRQQDVAASISQNVRLAKMCLIDLAGSERASATNARGARLREGANINRSLLALGNVINALADPKSKKQHIPYRNSKLTRLLKDSLGGNCRTIMIAAVSPSSLSFEDTYNTLKYANRAKDIKSSVKSNIVSLDSHISQYVKICEQQKKEIIMLKDKLAACEDQKVDIPAQCSQSLLLRSNQQQTEIQRFRDVLKCLFTNREEIRKEFLSLEMRQKENELKTSHQQQRHNQVHMMCSEEKAAKATCKRDQRIAMLKTQYVHIVKKKEEAMKRFEENTDWLHRVENEMRLSNSDGQIPEELCKELKCCHLQIEVNDLKTQIQYMMHLASLQEQENKHAEKLLNAALPVLFQENNMLRAAQLLDDSAEADFKKVENLVQRERAVVWADQPIVEERIQNGHPDISLVMAFPNLTCSPSTPCSAKQNERLPERPVEARNSKFALVRPFAGLPSDELKENIDLGATDATFQSPKRTRRKLMVSPLAKDRLEPPNTLCSHKLDDSLTRDLLPILYTPDTLRPTSTTTNHLMHTVTKQETAPGAVPQQSLVYTNIIVPAKVSQSDCILNETTEIDMNSTVILHKGTDVSTGELTSDVDRKPLLPCTSTVFQRPVVSACANNPGKPIEKPSYMSMTSAAARKRKLLSDSSCNVIENKVGLPTAKRIRQDIFNASKALRVRKVTVGEDFGRKPVQREEPRTLTRSVSEGNLIPAAKRTFTFMKSKPFMRIAKK